MTTRTDGPPRAEGPATAVLAAYDRQVDGLFTYCLSVLCEHDTATEALREVRDLAQRHGARLAEPGLVRAWLFSLARYCCLRRLADGAGGTAGTGLTEAEAARRRRELASLAWPEAAGTDPEQREALELSARHRLTPLEVAAVLGLPFDATRALLGAAEAEVARTRSALLVLGVGSCPELDRLGGAGAESWRDWVLGPALRRELVQHVVECPTCRGTAERVAEEAADGAGRSGSSRSSGLSGLAGLPLLTAPAVAASGTPGSSASSREEWARDGAVTYLPRASGSGRGAGAEAAVEPGLRFDQSGFPRHRVPDAGRGLAVRRRVVTTGVLAAVLAAPVVTLWAGHRGGVGPGATAAVSSVRVDEAGRQEEQRTAGAGGVGVTTSGAGSAVGTAVSGVELARAGAMGAETLLPGYHWPVLQGPAVPVPGRGATPLGSQALIATPAAVGPGRGPGWAAGGGADRPAPAGLLTVEAGEYGNRTVLTLTNSGGSEIRWHAVVDAAWLRLSRDSGTLEPGQRITVIVTVDDDLAPAAHWTARIALPPSEAVVTLEGGPQDRGGSTSAPASPTPTAAPTATATPAPSASPTATATPSTTPAPTATPTAQPTGTPAPPPPPHSPSPTATASPGGTATPHPRSGGSAPPQASPESSPRSSPR
ncbi:sigma-70 family RNA polymerase sigma factor [Streptomyces sp. SP17BM10]|uniref:BACON domain-containing protein n=1 Tax=Streptomyces sp. SP17BM10 TaxID=3002530 RepID=UPI002E769AE0|nr:sigma-70 family RNA polymerase sigma factor [Streptomyces sp. SP17BM10]MEE1786769.1 sigma-70 family RNA polymerase sigma factor [Streptomyces sp. SP17BM10]